MSTSILEREAPAAMRRISYGADPLQFADLRLPDGAGPHPCVVAIHGGFWRNRYTLDHLGHFCAALADAGVATWSLEYRRVGDRDGGWPGTFRDVAAGAAHLFRHAHEFDIDAARVAVLGHSAGGHLASWLAGLGNVPRASPIQSDPLPFVAALPLAGVLDLRQGWADGLGSDAVAAVMGGSPADLPDRYDAGSPFALAPSAVPHLVIHGADDDIVRIEMSERYVTHARQRGGDARTLRLDGAGHFDVIDPDSAVWPTIREAILELIHPWHGPASGNSVGADQNRP